MARNLVAPIADAEKLYRQGNVVRVVGQLDCRMEYQGGEAVRLKLAEIDAEWAAPARTSSVIPFHDISVVRMLGSGALEMTHHCAKSHIPHALAQRMAAFLGYS